MGLLSKLFKKEPTYPPDEVGAELCRMVHEWAEDSLEGLNRSAEMFGVIDPDLYRREYAALSTFTMDVSVYAVFGNGPKRDAIMEAIYVTHRKLSAARPGTYLTAEDTLARVMEYGEITCQQGNKSPVLLGLRFAQHSADNQRLGIRATIMFQEERQIAEAFLRSIKVSG